MVYDLMMKMLKVDDCGRKWIKYQIKTKRSSIEY